MAKAKHKSPSRHLNHMAGAMCYRLLTEIPDALYMIELSVPMVSRVIGTGISYSESYSNHELAEHLRIPDTSVKKTAQVRQNLVKLCELFEVNTKFAVLLEFILLMNVNPHAKFLLDNLELPDEAHDFMQFFEEISDLARHEITEAVETLMNRGIFATDNSLTLLQWIEISQPIQHLLTKEVVTSCEQVLSRFLVESPAAQFDIDNFEYVNTDLYQQQWTLH